MSEPYLTELAEHEAPDEIRVIYQEIRRLSGVPMTALIYRHVATIPGALMQVWAGLEPLLQAGHIQQTAWRVAADLVEIEPLPPVGRTALAALGVDEEAHQAIGRVLRAYNRAGPINLLAVNCLEMRMANPLDATVGLDRREWSPPEPIGDLPPMTRPAEMTPVVRALIEDLSCRDDGAAERAVPSLYRHFCSWPGFVALLHVLLIPRFQDGSVRHAAAGLRSNLQIQAAPLSRALPPLSALANVKAVNDTLTRFSELIPEMVVVGNLLERALR